MLRSCISLLLIVFLLSPAVSLAGARRGPPSGRSSKKSRSQTEPISQTLEHLLTAWDGAGSDERTLMARFFGLFSYQPARERLRLTARGEGPDAVASLVALGAMGDTGAAPIFRRHLRTSNQPAVVAASALALAGMRDRFSVALLVLALLDGRGGEEVAPALLRALVRLEPRWMDRYLDLLHRDGPNGTVRIGAASILATLKPGRRVSRRMAVVLAGASSEMLSGDAWDAETLYRVEMAVWGMSRAGKDACRSLLTLLDDEASRGGEYSNRVQQVIGMAHPACLRNAGAAGALWVRYLAGLVELAEGFRPHGFPLPDPVESEEAVDWVIRLSNAMDLWDASVDLAAFARETDRRMHGIPGGRGRWDPYTLLDMPIRDRIGRTPWAKLEERAAPPPEAFDRFESGLRQPGWFPAGLEITVDDGPRPGRLEPLLDVLDAYGVKATFFFIGVNLIDESIGKPDRIRKLLDRIIRTGHLIGYHTMDHETRFLKHIQNWESGQVLDDVRLFQRVLDIAAGRHVPISFGRCPGGMGARLAWVRAVFREAGFLASSVAWTLGPKEWPAGAPRASVRAIARSMVASKRRHILLLHETVGVHREVDTFLKELRKVGQESPSEVRSR